MTTTITKERALDLLRQAVAQDGYGVGYVYPRVAACRYADESGPSCLVGHALHLAGFALDRLVSLDVLGDEGESIMAETLPAALPAVSVEAAAVFQAAQTQQDIGEPWGAALRAAEAVAR